MAFNCGSPSQETASASATNPAMTGHQQQQEQHQQPPLYNNTSHHTNTMGQREHHSVFGDGYSMTSQSNSGFNQHNNNQNHHHNQHHHHQQQQQQAAYHDEPEADYDDGATDLYRRIENKDWDGALSRLEVAPIEAKTWVSRREHHGSGGGGGHHNITGSSSAMSVELQAQQQQRKLRWRLLPLHAVCIFRAPLALIEALIEVYVDGPQMKDDQGMLPVHLACRNGASKGVVLTLLEAFPDSLLVRDRKGRTPVDLVEASSSANREAVLFSIRRFQKEYSGGGYQPQLPQQPTSIPSNLGSIGPGGSSVTEPPVVAPNTKVPSPAAATGPSSAPNLMTSPAQQQQIPMGASGVLAATLSENEVDYEHRTVLFRLILKKDWKAAAARATNFPEEASTYIVTKGFNGNLRFLPIHKACVLLPPDYLIEALVAAYPSGCQSTDQDGWLPLHCACFYGASETVINCLLQANPKAASYKDDENRLPLHYACLKGASCQIVDLLLQAFIKGALSKDHEGRLPIHHGCSKGAPEGVIDSLLKAAPKGAQSKDDQGRLALHHACRKHASERIVRTLLRVYPRAAQIKDDQDKLPIHYICQNIGSSSSASAVVGLLLTTYPESINVTNGFGYTPLAEAKALVGSSSPADPKIDQVIKVLEKFKQEQDKIVEETEGGASDKNGASEQQKQVVEELQQQVVSLQGQVDAMSTVLCRALNDMGKDMDRGVRKDKDPLDIMEKFAASLLELQKEINNTKTSTAQSSSKKKTPLKNRSSTPIKSLLGRVTGGK